MPRSVAYSGKKKKAQLQQKRQNKTRKAPLTLNVVKSDDDEPNVSHVNTGSGDAKYNRHEKYKLLFQNESREELQKAKEVAQTQVVEFDELNCRLDRQDFHTSHTIPYPRRPDWDGATTPAKIDAIENEAFDKYLEEVHEKYDTRSLSFFEHNLETWRQLWRLIETADIVVIVADSRHPVLHFPPSLYDHLKELKKKCILILSKIDLIRPEVYVAWKSYFTTKYPDLNVVGFTCFDRFSYRENKHIQQKRSRTVKYGNQFGSQLGPVELGEVVQKLFPEQSFDEWLNTLHILNDNQEPQNHSRESSENEGGVRIGFVGHTNVGKSSIMNTLVGEKHFSMSIRPGHTKILQTWEVASNVTLIDSPGIIFPSYYPKELQGKDD